MTIKVVFEDLVFDEDARIITRDNGRMEILTSGKAKLLCIMIENAREVMNRDELFMRTMGQIAGSFDRTIDNMVSRLRRKIESDALRPRIISTIRNRGYFLTSDMQILQ